MAEEELVNKNNQNDDQQFSRRRRLIGKGALIVTIIAVAMSVFQFYSAGFRMLPAMQHRAIHLSFALVLTFLLYPRSKLQIKKISIIDYLLVLLSISIGLYLFIEYRQLVYRAGDPIFLDLVMGFIAIVLVLEATRRVMGWPMVIVALVFLLYAYFGPYMPAGLAHKGYKLKRIIDHMYLTNQGLYGVAIYVSSTFVYTFVLFGALLEATGGSKFFIDFAFALTGKSRGGPAKAAVLSSGLMGMMVYFRAGKLGITGVPKEKLPKLIPILKKGGHLILPPIAIIYFLIAGYSPIKASFYAIVAVSYTHLRA